MSSFLAVEPDLAIDGGLNADDLKHLIENYKSVLYVCCDELHNPSSPDFG